MLLVLLLCQQHVFADLKLCGTFHHLWIFCFRKSILSPSLFVHPTFRFPPFPCLLAALFCLLLHKWILCLLLKWTWQQQNKSFCLTARTHTITGHKVRSGIVTVLCCKWLNRVLLMPIWFEFITAPEYYRIAQQYFILSISLSNNAKSEWVIIQSSITKYMYYFLLN